MTAPSGPPFSPRQKLTYSHISKVARSFPSSAQLCWGRWRHRASIRRPSFDGLWRRKGCGPLHQPQSDCTNVTANGPRTEIGRPGLRIVRLLNQEPPCTTVTARLSSTDSCCPYPIRRFAPPSPLRGEGGLPGRAQLDKLCESGGGRRGLLPGEMREPRSTREEGVASAFPRMFRSIQSQGHSTPSPAGAAPRGSPRSASAPSSLRSWRCRPDI